MQNICQNSIIILRDQLLTNSSILVVICMDDLTMPDIHVYEFIFQKQCILLLIWCLTRTDHVSAIACLHSAQTNSWGKMLPL